MKKGLILLPMLGGLLLSGCQFTIFGKTIKLFEKDNKEEKGSNEGSNNNQGGNENESTSGGGMKDNVLTLDFSDSYWKDEKVTPYIGNDEPGEMKSFEFVGMEYNDVGCYASAYSGDYYLMMKNTGYTADETNAPNGYATNLAFFGNKNAFSKPIKKVEVQINGGSSSGNTIYRVNIGTSAFESAPTDGGASGKKGQTISTTSSDSGAYYFAVSTNRTSDNKTYNGQIKKVVVTF